MEIKLHELIAKKIKKGQLKLIEYHHESIYLYVLNDT